ncbi:hypothetical protein HK101_011698, partial [Irineochytrium annulatum]
KLYYDAESHFVYGTLDSARAAGHMAHEWGSQNYCSDAGYFIARVVLQLLAQRKLQKAHAAFTTFLNLYTTAHPADIIARVPFKPVESMANGEARTELVVLGSRLTNFSHLLLLCVQRGAADQFANVRAQYRTSLSLEGYLYELLDRVADVWFGLGPKKQPNIIEDLMKSMFAGPSASGGAITGGRPPLMDMD